jgi:hypothetical protein
MIGGDDDGGTPRFSFFNSWPPFHSPSFPHCALLQTKKQVEPVCFFFAQSHLVLTPLCAALLHAFCLLCGAILENHFFRV